MLYGMDMRDWRGVLLNARVFGGYKVPSGPSVPTVPRPYRMMDDMCRAYVGLPQRECLRLLFWHQDGRPINGLVAK